MANKAAASNALYKNYLQGNPVKEEQKIAGYIKRDTFEHSSVLKQPVSDLPVRSDFTSSEADTPLEIITPLPKFAELEIFMQSFRKEVEMSISDLIQRCNKNEKAVT